MAGCGRFTRWAGISGYPNRLLLGSCGVVALSNQNLNTMADEKSQNSAGVGLQLQLIESDAGQELLAIDLDENFQKSGSESAKYPLSTTEKDAERLRDIVKALAEGASLRTIQKRWSVGYHTLKSIEGKYIQEIAARKERLARKFEFAAELQVDRVIERPDSLDINRAFMTAGTFVDKAALLRGEATSINKTVGNDDVSPSSFDDYVETLKQAGATGLGGVDGGAKKGLAPAEQVIDLPHEGGTDKQSV